MLEADEISDLVRSHQMSSGVKDLQVYGFTRLECLLINEPLAAFIARDFRATAFDPRPALDLRAGVVGCKMLEDLRQNGFASWRCRRFRGR